MIKAGAFSPACARKRSLCCLQAYDGGDGPIIRVRSRLLFSCDDDRLISMFPDDAGWALNTGRHNFVRIALKRDRGEISYDCIYP